MSIFFFLEAEININLKNCQNVFVFFKKSHFNLFLFCGTTCEFTDIKDIIYFFFFILIFSQIKLNQNTLMQFW